MEKFVFPMSFRGSHVSSIQFIRAMGYHWGGIGSKSGHKTYMVHRSSPTAPAYEGNVGAM
jgi:hypothetical protein